MNALIKKEIRLLLPGWLAVLLLEMVQPWIWRDADVKFMCTTAVFFFGLLLLAVDSFGREFSLGTFSLLLAQPVERRRIWRSKITVLFSAAALILAAFFASHELLIQKGSRFFVSFESVADTKKDFLEIMYFSGLVLLTALSSGLWVVLLLRQTAASVWIGFLVPLGLLMLTVFSTPAKWIDNDHIAIPLVSGLFGGYSLAGFWLAHRLFFRAQDVAWSGGTISFSTWRYFQFAARTSLSPRVRQPVRALLKKEFQLHSISLFCAAALLALHLGVFLLRSFYVVHHKNSFADGVSDFFWALWLVMPLVIGCTAVAEERKLGVAASQFCLPVSRRVLFAVKFVPALFFGVLLGGVMPLVLEVLAARLGSPCDFFKPQNHAGNNFFDGIIWFYLSIVMLATAFSLAAFFASTLAKNSMQALSIAIVTIVGGFLCLAGIPLLGELHGLFFGLVPWPSALPMIIALPTILVTAVWMLYGNFSYFHEAGRLWRRNIFGLIAAVIFVFASSALIYNRAWEMFEPAEPAHGAARLSLAQPPRLDYEWGNLLVRLPAGRVWFDRLENFYPWNSDNHWQSFWWALVRPLPKSGGPQQFIAGSNWVSATASRYDLGNFATANLAPPRRAILYLPTAGVKADGTLWFSRPAGPGVWNGAEMTQFGSETNWRQVKRCYGAAFGNFLLLKQDGTLWRTGTNHFNWDGWQTNWPVAPKISPYQIGTDAGWREIFNGWIGNAQKADGTVWLASLDSKTRQDQVVQVTNYDGVNLETFSRAGDNQIAYVSHDGRLWIGNRSAPASKVGGWTGTGFLPVGGETNWISVAMTWDTMIALKADGTLWQWPLSQESTAATAKSLPVRLGIHTDWVALAATWDGVVSLAADGSLWVWPSQDSSDPPPLMKPPKQPKWLGNVLGKAD